MIEEIVSDQVAALDLPIPHAARGGDYDSVSGQVAAAPDGRIITGDFDGEVRAVLNNLQAIVVAAGGSLADVCKTTVYLLNATLFEPVNLIYSEYFPQPRPARSTVVAPLSNPDLRIEIDAVVYLPVGKATRHAYDVAILSVRLGGSTAQHRATPWSASGSPFDVRGGRVDDPVAVQTSQPAVPGQTRDEEPAISETPASSMIVTPTSPAGILCDKT